MKKVKTIELYGEEYCKRINAKEWRFTTIPPVMEVIYDYFKPESIIDVGCANGIHLQAFRKLGCKKLLGIEGTGYWAPYIQKLFGTPFLIADMRASLPDLGKFDLVLCLEVLEHLEEKFAKRSAKNLTILGNTLCISACPIKDGFHHFNPQPKEYWIEIFKIFNFNYCKDESDYLMSIFKTMNCSGWFKNDLKVFRKDEN